MKTKKLFLLLAMLLMSLGIHAQNAEFETAAEAVKNMKVGWNLQNTYEYISEKPELNVFSNIRVYDASGNCPWPTIKPELMWKIKNAGFNVMRIPLTWTSHMDERNRVNSEWMKRVHELVDMVISLGMYCIINTHHDSGGPFHWLSADEYNLESISQKLSDLWTQIAEEFKDYDNHLIFEGYNEMLDSDNSWAIPSENSSTYEALNSLAQTFVNSVRETGGNNRYRNLVINTYAAYHEQKVLDGLVIPTDVLPNHLIVEVHAYEGWNENRQEFTESCKQAIDEVMLRLNKFSTSRNIPILIGEWGAYTLNLAYEKQMAEAAKHASYFIQQTKKYGFATTNFMGLIEHLDRARLKWSMPQIKNAILLGYYGQDYHIPEDKWDAYNGSFTYEITFFPGGVIFPYRILQNVEGDIFARDKISIDEFKGYRIELEKAPENETLEISIDDKENEWHVQIENAVTPIDFEKIGIKKDINGFSLFNRSEERTCNVKILRSVLIKRDGTEIEAELDYGWNRNVTGVYIQNDQPSNTEFETAAEAVKNMKVGYCLGNTLEAFTDNWIGETHSWQEYEKAWGNPITKPEFMKMIRKAGFNAVRVPVTWFPHMDANGKIDEAWMRRVHEVVDYVIDQGMYCILNSHHDTSHKDAWLWADDSYYKVQERYRGLWSQIATEFKDYDEHLLFAGWNEILERQEIFGGESYKDRYKVLNQINQDFVDAVRFSGGNNVSRNLLIGPYYNWSVYEGDEIPQHYIDSFQSLTVPNDVSPGHILFEVHAYFKTSDPQVNKVLDRTIQDMNTYLASKKVSIVIGEWGPANEYDNPPQVDAFAHYFMEQTRTNNIATFAWNGPLSYGEYRNLPAFEEPSYIKAIMKGYYGDDYEPVLITTEDYDDEGHRKQFVHTVRYDNLWAELNLFDDEIPLKLKNYKGIRVEFAEPINVNDFGIKVYADNGAVEEGRTPNSSTSATVFFSDFNVNEVINRVTLQYCKEAKGEAKVVSAWLIRQDGTEEYSDLSPFHGCEITNVEKYVPASGIEGVYADGQGNAVIFNINGQKLSKPKKGINIIRGKKVVVK